MPFMRGMTIASAKMASTASARVAKLSSIPDCRSWKKSSRPIRPSRTTPRARALGYNPYESGLLKRKPTAPKRDLRELSKWIEMKKRVGNKRGE